MYVTVPFDAPVKTLPVKTLFVRPCPDLESIRRHFAGANYFANFAAAPQVPGALPDHHRS